MKASPLLQVIQPLLLLPILYNHHGDWIAFSRSWLIVVSPVIETWLNVDGTCRRMK